MATKLITAAAILLLALSPSDAAASRNFKSLQSDVQKPKTNPWKHGVCLGKGGSCPELWEEVEELNDTLQLRFDKHVCMGLNCGEFEYAPPPRHQFRLDDLVCIGLNCGKHAPPNYAWPKSNSLEVLEEVESDMGATPMRAKKQFNKPKGKVGKFAPAKPWNFD